MTQATVRELTMSTIAVVVNEPPTLPRISEEDLRKILKPPFSVGQAVSGESVVSSNRDQIDVIFSLFKINVRDLSGGTDFLNNKIPPIVHAFLGWYQATTITIRSYGINFIVVVNIDSPEVWIRDKMLNSELGRISGKELLRATTHISLRADRKTWNVQFNRNADGKLEINFNASEEIDQLPSREQLRLELKQQYDGLMDLMGKLGI